MAILKLAGGAALPAFRLDKLSAALSPLGLSVRATRFWHFVEVEREPTGPEATTLGRLLTYGPDLPPPLAAE
jgi:hypothetical protein